MTALISKKKALIVAQMVLLGVFAQSFGVLEPAGLGYAGVFDIKSNDLSLDGSGITIASLCRSFTYIDGEPQNDYMFNVGHKCLSGREIDFIDGVYFANGISEHATSIGGILTGFDPNGFTDESGEFHYEGVAPGAKIDVYEFSLFVSKYLVRGKAIKADVLTMSLSRVFETWWSRGIENLIDETGIVVLAGIGNGTEEYDPVSYPGAGANVIGVGVINSVMIDGELRYALPSAEHSSMGPTGDGRCGPDIVAPGNLLVPDANSINGYSMSGDWSSFATPVASGTVGLLMQKAKSDEELNDAANNLVMRAIVLNSARKLPYWHKGEIGSEDDHEYGLDFLQGAGALDAANAYKHLVAGRGGVNVDGTIGWDKNAIERIAGSENIYKIDLVDNKDKFITATLVWNRHYKSKYPFEAVFEKDTDLRLEVWAVDGDGQRKLVDYCDSINENVEHICLPVEPEYVSFDLIVKVNDAGDKGSEYENYGFAWSVLERDSRSDVWKYDLNTDGKVDKEDVNLLLKKLDKPATDVRGDINIDGVIDVKDVVAVLEATK